MLLNWFVYYNDIVKLTDKESLAGANTKSNIHDVVHFVTVIK